MLSRNRSPFLSPLRDRRGLTTLELAIVSPALIAGMIALAEVSYSLTSWICWPSGTWVMATEFMQ